MQSKAKVKQVLGVTQAIVLASAAFSDRANSQNADNKTPVSSSELKTVMVKENLSIGFLPMSRITSAIFNSKSPSGSFRLLNADGPIQVADYPENIKIISQKFSELKQSPAFLTLSVSFTTARTVETQSYPSPSPIVSYEVPIPTAYDRARVYFNGQRYVVIPPRPKDFKVESYAPGTTVNIAPVGYRTLDSQITISGTQEELTVIKTNTKILKLGEDSVIPVSLNVTNLAELRAFAEKTNAVAPSDPVWKSASTELMVNQILSGGDVPLTIVMTPIIKVISVDLTSDPIIIPLNAQKQSVPFNRSINNALRFPANPNFLKVFFGTVVNAAKETPYFNIRAIVKYTDNTK